MIHGQATIRSLMKDHLVHIHFRGYCLPCRVVEVRRDQICPIAIVRQAGPDIFDKWSTGYEPDDSSEIQVIQILSAVALRANQNSRVFSSTPCFPTLEPNVELVTANYRIKLLMEEEPFAER